LRKEIEELKKAAQGQQQQQQQQQQPAATPEQPQQAANPPPPPPSQEQQKPAQPAPPTQEQQKPTPPPPKEQKPAEQQKPAAQPANPPPPATEPQKPVVDKAFVNRLANLEARVKQTNEKLGTVIDSMLKLAEIGETLETLSRSVPTTPDNAKQQPSNVNIAKEVADQLQSVRKNIENSKASTQKSVESRINLLRDQVTNLDNAFNQAETLLTKSSGSGLLIVFILVQIAFAATMFYINKHKNDSKKFF